MSGDVAVKVPFAWRYTTAILRGTDTNMAYVFTLSPKLADLLFMTRQLPKKCFRSHVLANLKAHHLAAMPVL